MKWVSSRKTYFQPGKFLGGWSAFERVPNITFGSIELSCGADVTTIPRFQRKTLTQIETCYVDVIAKAEELLANSIQDHLKRL